VQARCGRDDPFVEPRELEAHFEPDTLSGAKLVATRADRQYLTPSHTRARCRGHHAEPVDHGTPRARSAVEERELGTLDVHPESLVDAETRQRGKRVLDRADAERPGSCSVSRSPSRFDRGRTRRRPDGELVDPRFETADPQRDGAGPRTNDHASRLPRVEADPLDDGLDHDRRPRIFAIRVRR
jgi:hypothetical protein